MKIFFVIGCSYSYGASLYYHEWMKNKPDGFKVIPWNHFSWNIHYDVLSSSDHKFRRDNRFVGLLSKELGMDYIGATDVGGNNVHILDESFRMLDRAKKINEDKTVNNKSVEFMVVQMTHSSRDYIPPTQDELREWSDFKSFDDHFNEHQDSLVVRLDVLNEECKKLNIRLYVMSMKNIIGNKIKSKEYFIPIIFENTEYISIEHIQEQKNSRKEIEGIDYKPGKDYRTDIHYVYTMGKNIQVPLYICDELYQYGIEDTHLGLNGHKIVKDSIIKKIKGV